jgi:hypothetical protein
MMFLLFKTNGILFFKKANEIELYFAKLHTFLMLIMDAQQNLILYELCLLGEVMKTLKIL